MMRHVGYLTKAGCSEKQMVGVCFLETEQVFDHVWETIHNIDTTHDTVYTTTYS